MHQSDQCLLQKVFDREAAVVDRFGDDRLRELALDHFAPQSFGRALVDAQAHAGRPHPQVGNERGHEPAARGADDAEARVARFETLQHGEVGSHRLQLALHTAPAFQHDRAELGGLRAAPPAHEQRDPELSLELADLVGDVRLHRVQSVGGGGERSFLRDREQRLEVPELHRASRPATGYSIVESDGYDQY